VITIITDIFETPRARAFGRGRLRQTDRDGNGGRAAIFRRTFGSLHREAK
jgi:hypothetical protein